MAKDQKQEQQAVAKVDQLPAYIKAGGNRGSEEVGRDDLVIPRLEIAQALSPCLKPGEPEYIPGIKAGDIYNSITRESYGPAVTVCPVLFQKQWLVWQDRKKGGGFRGAFNTQEEAASSIAATENPRDWTAQDTGQHMVLVVKEDGSTEEAILSMARTKMKISRQWNALVRINGNDRFSRTYVIHTSEESGQSGEYYNFGVSNSGYPTEAVYRKAEALYGAISSGKRDVVMDTGGEEGSIPASSDEF